MAQQILLGCALHNLWGRAAPKHVKGAVASQLDTVAQPLGDEVEGDENAWRDLHSWRVSRTCEFFSQPDTVSHLVVVLQSLRPAHAVMAWIMKHTSQRPSDAKQHKLAAVRQFVEPATSPVFKALAHGADLLQDMAHWRAAWAYFKGPCTCCTRRSGSRCSLPWRSCMSGLLPACRGGR